MFFTKLKNRLKTWKPIHLCWLFRLLHLPIPPYFIGVAVILTQSHYLLGEDDNAQPDDCTWDANEDTPRTSQPKGKNFMVRLQVNNTGIFTQSLPWKFYYNNVDDPDTATQVTTSSNVVRFSDGMPTDQDSTDTNKMSVPGKSLWQNGVYVDTSDQTVNYQLLSSYYTEFQFCAKFMPDAVPGQDYYFYVFGPEGRLNNYTNVAKVTAVEAAFRSLVNNSLASGILVGGGLAR